MLYTKEELEMAEKNGTIDDLYGEIVHYRLRKPYPQPVMEATVNNFLSDPDNAQYKADFVAMQECRAKIKAEVKEEIKAVLYG